MPALSVDGKMIAFVAGDSLAAAMLRAGIPVMRLSRTGQPRSLFCGMGVCNDCVVTLDGKPNIRTCTTAAYPDAAVETGVK